MIKNLSSKKILVSKKTSSDSLLFKFKGLMFSPGLKDQGLIFIFNEEKKVQLHMFFVFFPIDVIFLDSNKKVVEVKKKLMPFTIYNPKEKAKYILELPIGTVEKSKTKIGDLIEF